MHLPFGAGSWALFSILTSLPTTTFVGMSFSCGLSICWTLGVPMLFISGLLVKPSPRLRGRSFALRRKPFLVLGRLQFFVRGSLLPGHFS